MPTYDYQCGTCSHRFEKFQSFSEEPIKVCPECGNAVKKVIAPSGIIFKGSGWYINDSKKVNGKPTGKPKTSESSETQPAASSESKPAASTETKPAASTENSSAKASEAAA
jgi:putative FmdB family regulatory protein